TNNCDSSKECCKQSHYISLKQTEWDDWIILPEEYNLMFVS
ncbi:hypothetical protein B4U79_19208, partial [Dinothrombium tinctorium]